MIDQYRLVLDRGSGTLTLQGDTTLGQGSLGAALQKLKVIEGLSKTQEKSTMNLYRLMERVSKFMDEEGKQTGLGAQPNGLEGSITEI